MLASAWQSSWRSASLWIAFFASLLVAWGALFAMTAEFAARAPIVLLGPGMGLLTPFFPDGASCTPWFRPWPCLPPANESHGDGGQTLCQPGITRGCGE